MAPSPVIEYTPNPERSSALAVKSTASADLLPCRGDDSTADLGKAGGELGASLLPVEKEKATLDGLQPPSSCQDGILDLSPGGVSLSSVIEADKNQSYEESSELFVYDNKFSVLPRSIGQFLNLRVLKLFSNEVTFLPKEVGCLTKLEHLYLKADALALSKLPSLENMKSLKSLELHQAPTRTSSFALPENLGHLKSLTRLAVCHHDLLAIPSEIGQLNALQELDFSFNRIAQLPPEIQRLSSLKSFKLASNRLTSLPSQLVQLSSLTSLDIANNRISSLKEVSFQLMPSLSNINAQYNKLDDELSLPEWIVCQLDGNETLRAGESESEDSDIEREVDSLCCSRGQGNVCADGPRQETDTRSSEAASAEVSKSRSFLPGQKACTVFPRNLEDSQRRARQERLKLRRSLSADRKKILESSSHVEIVEEVSSGEQVEELSGLDSEVAGVDRNVLRKEPGTEETHLKSNDEYVHQVDGQSLRCCIHRDVFEQAVLSSTEEMIDTAAGQVYTAGKAADQVICEKTGLLQITRVQEVPSKSSEESIKCVEPLELSSGKSSDVSTIACVEEITSPYPGKQEQQEGVCERDWELAWEGPSTDEEKKSNKGNEDHQQQHLQYRKQGRSKDINPKPSKRRRSSQRTSNLSLKYYTESLCGFNDRLNDGFYDAGRLRPFKLLDQLHKEPMCLHSREVILVDRDLDEELDIIVTSAQSLLMKLGLTNKVTGQIPSVQQRAIALALFVSDCFGGSDKSENTVAARRAALGRSVKPNGTVSSVASQEVTGCACGSEDFASNLCSSTRVRAAVALPSMSDMCEQAVRLLKSQQGSNVVRIGALPYGICRHRAILFKYLCDHAEPAIPCQLVRGFLNHSPHAWNVVRPDDPEGERLLVDACRPLDIRPEQDLDLVSRYLPMQRIKLPGRATLEWISPVLCEEIGRGASGAVVRRCVLGTFCVAVKIVRTPPSPQFGTSSCFGEGASFLPPLHELQMLASLPSHPCMLEYYGHQIMRHVGREKKVTVDQELLLFMEHMKGGSLEEFLQRRKAEGAVSLPPRVASCIALAVAEGLACLHNCGIIHRDIKSSNILVGWDEATWQRDGLQAVATTGSVKIGDFSSAVSMTSPQFTCHLAQCGTPPADMCVGTPRWMAPEVMRAAYSRHAYGTEVDMWSFGCLLFELLSLAIPYAALSDLKLRHCVQMGQRPQLPSHLQQFSAAAIPQTSPLAPATQADADISKALIRVMYACTTAEAQERLTAAAAASELAIICCRSSSLGKVRTERETLSGGIVASMQAKSPASMLSTSSKGITSNTVVLGESNPDSKVADSVIRCSERGDMRESS